MKQLSIAVFLTILGAGSACLAQTNGATVTIPHADIVDMQPSARTNRGPAGHGGPQSIGDKSGYDQASPTSGGLGYAGSTGTVGAEGNRAADRDEDRAESAGPKSEDSARERGENSRERDGSRSR